jgi:hypothetical protein
MQIASITQFRQFLDICVQRAVFFTLWTPSFLLNYATSEKLTHGILFLVVKSVL